MIRNGRITPPHSLLKVGAGDFGEQVFGKVDPQVSVANEDVAEAESEGEISISVRNNVSYGCEEAVKGVSYKTDPERDCLSNGNRVRVNHPKSFLEGGSLTGCRRNLLLALVPDQVRLQVWVHHETGSHFVNVFALALRLRITRLH